MKRFNGQTGCEFEKYMSRLEDNRDKYGFGTNYVETNRKLVSSYKRCSNPKKKLEIRNKLVMFNIKLAHEILYKKLNVDISKENSIDILQEINLYLIESVDKVLEYKTNKVSKTLYFLIMSSLSKIVKKYYDYSAGRILISNPDRIIMKTKEKEKENINRYVNEKYLNSREYHILRESFKDCASLELIGCEFGLTTERVKQIKEKAIKKIREAIEDIKIKSKKNVDNEVSKFLKVNPNIKYVIYYPTETIIQSFFESYADQCLLEKLIFRGIDLREWLIVDNKPREYYVKEIGCKRINHLSTTNYYTPSLIHDRNLNEISNLDSSAYGLNSYYDFLLRTSTFNEGGVISTLGRNYITEYLIKDSIAGKCKEELKKCGCNDYILKEYLERKSYLLNHELAKMAIIKVYLTKL
jgi:hypothetical protein